MQTINLDISKMNVIPTLYAKQTDVGRKFKAVITDSDVPYSVAGTAVSVWYSGASGEGNYTDVGADSAVSVSGNEITVELITQMLSNPGSGVLCLVINSANGDQIGTWNIPYLVEKIPGVGSPAAQEYFTAFSQAVQNLPYPDASLSLVGKAADAAAVGAALAGKAPAGYGLGGWSTSVTDFNEAFGSGWYYGNNVANAPFHYSFVFAMKANDDRVIQIAYDVAQIESSKYAYGASAIRRYLAGVWGEWEYVNPPMLPGVEYRTTERWNGKVVYTKLINFGALPNATIKTVKIGLDASQIFHVDFKVYNGEEMCSDVGNHVYNCAVYVYNTELTVVAKADMSAFNGFAALRYTKD